MIYFVGYGYQFQFLAQQLFIHTFHKGKFKKIKLLLHPKPGAADDPEKKESLRNDEFTLVYRLPYLKIILNHKKFVYV